MKVRELIKQLADEDLDSTVYVRMFNKNNEINLDEHEFATLEGIAVMSDSYQSSKNMITCTTLIVDF